MLGQHAPDTSLTPVGIQCQAVLGQRRRPWEPEEGLEGRDFRQAARDSHCPGQQLCVIHTKLAGESCRAAATRGCGCVGRVPCGRHFGKPVGPCIAIRSQGGGGALQLGTASGGMRGHPHNFDIIPHVLSYSLDRHPYVAVGCPWRQGVPGTVPPIYHSLAVQAKPRPAARRGVEMPEPREQREGRCTFGRLRVPWQSAGNMPSSPYPTS